MSAVQSTNEPTPLGVPLDQALDVAPPLTPEQIKTLAGVLRTGARP